MRLSERYVRGTPAGNDDPRSVTFTRHIPDCPCRTCRRLRARDQRRRIRQTKEEETP